MLVKGIYLAIEKGARIIQLSVATAIYSTDLEKACRYAEEKGVLLVAASGNDGGVVSFPAAFPTVLSVGAIDEKGSVLPSSNQGAELDVVAPGYQIQTISRHGEPVKLTGTSIAAPQVTSIAAGLLKENPNLTPFQVRFLIESTAKDLGVKGWDPQTGFGLVDAQKAVALAIHPPADVYKGNQSMDTAAPLSISTEIQGMLEKDSLGNWYKIEVPYDGEIVVNGPDDDLIQIYNSNQEVIASSTTRDLHVMVNMGQIYLRIYQTKQESTIYRMLVSFHMKNDSQASMQANVIPISTREYTEWTGSFPISNAENWFAVDYPKPGKLELEMTTDNLRMDPVLTLQDGKNKEVFSDTYIDHGNRKWNQSLQIDSGRIYFQVEDYYHHEVIGQYHLKIYYIPDPGGT